MADVGRLQICLINWCCQKPEWIALSCCIPALQHQALLHVIVFLLQQYLLYLSYCPHCPSNGSTQKLVIILINLLALPNLDDHYILLVLPLKYSQFHSFCHLITHTICFQATVFSVVIAIAS